jgi:hypothetical protein
MPTYDYRCEKNDRIVEVRHGMSHKISTWGELCELAGMDPGQTEEMTPVVRLANGGNVVNSSALKNNMPAGCNPDACCGGGGCMLDG